MAPAPQVAWSGLDRRVEGAASGSEDVGPEAAPQSTSRLRRFCLPLAARTALCGFAAGALVVHAISGLSDGGAGLRAPPIQPRDVMSLAEDETVDEPYKYSSPVVGTPDHPHKECGNSVCWTGAICCENTTGGLCGTPGSICCGNSICSPGSTCCGDGLCAAPGSTCCGERGICSPGSTCCPSTPAWMNSSLSVCCSDGFQCCPEESGMMGCCPLKESLDPPTQCGAVKCPGASKCCNEGMCATPNSVCCGSIACGPGAVCCGDSICADTGSMCCGDGVCGPGSSCCNTTSGAQMCCGASAQCCPPSSGMDGCCPLVNQSLLKSLLSDTSTEA